MLIAGDDDNEPEGLAGVFGKIGGALKTAVTAPVKGVAIAGKAVGKGTASGAVWAAKATAGSPKTLLANILLPGSGVLMKAGKDTGLTSKAMNWVTGGPGPAPTVDTRPACGFWQRLSRFVGGSPDCQ